MRDHTSHPPAVAALASRVATHAALTAREAGRTVVECERIYSAVYAATVTALTVPTTVPSPRRRWFR